MAASGLGPSTTWAALLFEHSPIGQALVDVEGRWLRVNPALGAILGQDPHDLAGTPVEAVVHPDERAAAAASLAAMVGGDVEHDRLDLRYVRPDERIVQARVTSAAVRDALGAPRYVVVQVEDVTEAQRSERRHRAILEHASDLVVVLDRDARITYASPAAERILGYTVEQLLGTSGLDHVHPDDLELAAVELLAATEERGVVSGTPTPMRLIGADGEPVAVEAVASNLLDDDAVEGIIVSIRDVRERETEAASITEVDRRYRALAEAGHDAIVTVDDAGRVCSWNAGARRMLGYTPESIIGAPVTTVIPCGLAAEDGMSERTARHADGSDVDVEVSQSSYEQDGARYRITILRDVSARKAAEAQAREADERFRAAFDAAPVGMALVSPDGAFVQVNPALCRILGYEEDDLLRLSFQELTHPDDLAADLELVSRLAAGKIPSYRMEKRYVRADGDLVWAQLSVTVVRRRDGRPRYFVSQIEDVTERRAQTDGLAYRAHHDELTGLLNRHAAMLRLEQALARRHLAEIALLFVDLDGFKAVNDEHGHPAGDEVLRVVAARVRAALRPTDAAARFGGDEFIALCEGADVDQASAIAERVRQAVAEPVPLPGGATCRVTASVGVAVATPDDVAPTDLLERADRAMYAGKRVLKEVSS